MFHYAIRDHPSPLGMTKKWEKFAHEVSKHARRPQQHSTPEHGVAATTAEICATVIMR